MAVRLQWRDLILVMVGGAMGSGCRYLVGKLMGPTADARVPWHTFTVNVTGAFLLGLLVAVAARSGWPGWWRPLIAVGVLGGYTTFSTFSLESAELLLTGRPAVAFVYSLGSVVAGVGGVLAGRAVGRLLA